MRDSADSFGKLHGFCFRMFLTTIYIYMFFWFCPNIRNARRALGCLVSIRTYIQTSVYSFIWAFCLDSAEGFQITRGSKASKANVFSGKNNNSKRFSKTFSYRLHDCSKDISEIFIIFKLDKLIMIHVQKFCRDPILTCSNGRTKSHRSVLLTQTSPHLLFFCHLSWLLNRREGLKKNVTAGLNYSVLDIYTYSQDIGR